MCVKGCVCVGRLSMHMCEGVSLDAGEHAHMWGYVCVGR